MRNFNIEIYLKNYRDIDGNTFFSYIFLLRDTNT